MVDQAVAVEEEILVKTVQAELTVLAVAVAELVVTVELLQAVLAVMV